MNSIKRNTKIAGALFLVAMISSLVGGGLIESLPNNSKTPILYVGILLEIINAISVFGIGILLLPVLKQVWNIVAQVYFGFRIMEALACLSAALIPLFLFGESSDLRVFHTGTLIPLFFCSGALIFYTLLYASQLIPRFISIWGWVGVLFIIYLNVFQPQGEIAILFALPIILNEIFLGIWLITKGFNQLKIRILNK